MKKFSLVILAFAFALGTIVSVIPVKAPPEVRMYVWNTATSNNIYPGVTSGTMFTVSVFIQSPLAWKDTADGIISFSISIRFDPRALGPYTGLGGPAIKIATGFLSAYFVPLGGTVLDLTEAYDATTGLVYGYAEAVMEEVTFGAGGSGELMQFRLVSKSDTMASPLDLIKTGILQPGNIDISAVYVQAKAPTTAVPVEVVDDGYYVAQTNTFMFDLVSGYPPAIGSIWRDLGNINNLYKIDSHTDTDTDGYLDPSEQIDMTLQPSGPTNWYHVEWVNPSPVAGDGKTDLIVTFKELPEFPLGLGLLMAIAPLIPIAYIWRLRKNKVMKP